MTRVARLATLCLVVTAAVGVADARAQTAPAGAAKESRWFGEVSAGPTFGARTSSTVGGELAVRVLNLPMGRLDVFLEGGHIKDAGTAALEANAQLVATFLGGSATTAHKVKFGDAGLRYRIAATPMFHPYIAVGVGVAKVTTSTTFIVNGTDVTSQLVDLGVQLGGDLAWDGNKTLVMAGGGVNIEFLSKFFADVSYRYGHILPKTDLVENDVAIKTQRLQIGFGVRF
ncbi:MAG: outer membrane beta-barrel protein [Acidobacteria bacterium]|nr:outer membrane beta-barrel protein [Acidobacteriota bacterium]